MLLAAVRRPRTEAAATEPGSSTRQLGALLPYAAVTAAVLTSVIDVARGGIPDLFVLSSRSALILLLVARQILSLRENLTSTRTLEERVEKRTAELDTSRQRFAALVQQSSDVVTVVDRHGIIAYQSESSWRVLVTDMPKKWWADRYVSSCSPIKARFLKLPSTWFPLRR